MPLQIQTNTTNHAKIRLSARSHLTPPSSSIPLDMFKTLFLQEASTTEVPWSYTKLQLNCKDIVRKSHTLTPKILL